MQELRIVITLVSSFTALDERRRSVMTAAALSGMWPEFRGGGVQQQDDGKRDRIMGGRSSVGENDIGPATGPMRYVPALQSRGELAHQFGGYHLMPISHRRWGKTTERAKGFWFLIIRYVSPGCMLTA
jgi:hypothetical protein